MMRIQYVSRFLSNGILNLLSAPLAKVPIGAELYRVFRIAMQQAVEQF